MDPLDPLLTYILFPLSDSAEHRTPNFPLSSCRKQRWKNQRHRAGNRPILMINWPGHDGGLILKTVSEFHPKIALEDGK
jgi:hypothetical protein